jgi:hypothetical protein
MQATDILRKLLMIAALDPDRGVKFAAVRTLLEILKKDPSKLTFLASLSLTFREVYAVVCDIFRRIPARTESNFLEILKSVLPQIQQARQTHALDRLKDAMRLLLLIRNLAEGEKTIFMNCFRIPSWSGGEKILLLKILNRMSLYEYSGLNIDFMIQDYSRVDADAKREYLRFFGKLVYPSSKVRDLLCDALQGEPDEKLRNRIYRVLAAQFRELSEWPASEGAL